MNHRPRAYIPEAGSVIDPAQPYGFDQELTAMHRGLRTPLLWLPLLALDGCALIQPVQPWEKGVLAKPAMTFEADRLDNAFVEHTYNSKEAASGGSGVGGGGCGCN